MVSKISLIDINLRQIIEHLKKRMGVALPEEIIAVDYDQDADTLGIRFSLTDDVDSHLYGAGKIILGLDKQKNIVLIEILSFSEMFFKGGGLKGGVCGARGSTGGVEEDSGLYLYPTHERRPRSGECFSILCYRPPLD